MYKFQYLIRVLGEVKRGGKKGGWGGRITEEVEDTASFSGGKPTQIQAHSLKRSPGGNPEVKGWV